MRDARPRHRSRCRRRATLARGRASSAAVAGLRLLRPVRQFRSARAKLPRPRHAPSRREPGAAKGGQGGMRITRAEKSVLSDWWFTVDRLMFFGLLLLMGAGLVLSLAASPPIAAKYHLEAFYFVRRQAALLLPAIAIMFSASTLTPKQIGFLTIQPSEFVKPAFIVLTAWLFNESQKRRDIPGIQLAVALYAIFAVLLILQPDFGQTLLVTL